MSEMSINVDDCSPENGISRLVAAKVVIPEVTDKEQAVLRDWAALCEDPENRQRLTALLGALERG